jgi:AcrR family transcriptional regulator
MFWTVQSNLAMLTKKGQKTRARIVESAADLVLARGVGGTSLDDICAGTSTSRSQLFHYFPAGKGELVGALAALQAERVLDAQRPWLDTLDTWEAWEHWRDAVLAHYGSQPHWGCPIGALSAEYVARDAVRAHMERWRAFLRDGIERMRATSLLREDTDPEELSLAVFAALHGGLLLTQTMESLDPLRAAIDGALAALRAHAGT